MTAKIKRIVICVLCLLCGAVLFGACTYGTTVKEETERYNLKALVTYHANGGEFNNNETEANVYYKAGAKPLDIGKVGLTSGTISVAYAKHSFVDWYFAQTDENGNVRTDENGKVLLGEKVDFSVVLSAGDEWHVYAKWKADQKLEVLLAADDSIGGKLTYQGKEYTVGDVLYNFDFESSGKVEKPLLDVLTDDMDAPDGYVCANYYEDAACTKPVSWPVNAVGEDNMRIYVKYLTDDWTVVSDKTSARAMFLNNKDGKNSNKYYVANDIDATGNGGVLPVDATFSGIIRGNGFTIENLQFTNTMKNALVEGDTVSLLGKVEKSAVISDLTIKNAKISVGNKNSASFVKCYFLAESIDGEAQISNLKVDGGEIAFTKLGECNVNGKDPKEIAECPLYGGELHDGVTFVNKPTFKA